MRHDLLIRPQYAVFKGVRIPVAIGRGGIGEKRGEGDGITPAGIWEVEEWRVRPDRIPLPFTPTRTQDFWCDSPDESNYNQLIEWYAGKSKERMARADHLYDIVGIMNYNRNPIVFGKGSAIFIHQWRKPRHPTEGCIAFAKHHLEWIAREWRPSTRVIIQA